ncbi:hypothetical protein [Spongorhabdus nitratireducens]
MPDLILFIALLFWAGFPALAVTHPSDLEEELQLIDQLEIAIDHYAKTDELYDIGGYHFDDINELFLYWIERITLQSEQVRISHASSCAAMLVNNGLHEEVQSNQLVVLVDQLPPVEFDVESFIQLAGLINLCTTHILHTGVVKQKIFQWLTLWPAHQWLSYSPEKLLFMLMNTCQSDHEGDAQDWSEWLDTVLASLILDQQRTAIKHLILAFSATNPASYLANLQIVVQTEYECSNYFLTLVDDGEPFKLKGEQKQLMDLLRPRLAGGAY